jgi:pSer/pThr/pTyr-binding forkhead associated (FHA) protein
LPENQGQGQTICAACATPNPASMNFCKMCGEPLRANPVAIAPTAPGTDVKPKPRPALPSALAAVVGKPDSTPPSGPTIIVAPGAAAAKPSQTVVARKPMVGAAAVASTSPGTPARPVRACASCGGNTPVGFAFCQHCGIKLDDPPPPATIADAAIADTLASGDAADIVPLIKKRAAEPAAWARLVSLHRDGSDGASHPLVDESTDVGRSDGTVTFDDRFLAPRHARIEKRGAAAVVTPLEQTNGVYLRLRPGESCALVDGDQILVGKEVLRFEVLEPEERAQGAAIQHGVRLFGSPVRSPWARLRQIVQSGMARDVYHLCAIEVVLGREEGDLRFSDDEFMSRRHAKIVNRDGRFEIADLESSNGTFVRVRGERALQKGDQLRMGDQLFRFE